MRGVTHFSVGVAIGTIIGTAAGHPVISAVVGGIASIVPDLDHPGSWLGRLLRPLAVWVEEKLGHREATHTLMFCIPAGFVIGLIPAIILDRQMLILAGILGSASHIVMDAATKTGVRPFRVYLPRMNIPGWNKIVDKVDKLTEIHYKGGVAIGKSKRLERVIAGVCWTITLLLILLGG